MSNVVAARLLAKAAHGHVLDHACPQWADGRMRSIRGHRGSSLELKVAGPSMLGVRRPDRHLLPRITPSTMRGPRRVLPPARAGSFFDPTATFAARVRGIRYLIRQRTFGPWACLRKNRAVLDPFADITWLAKNCCGGRPAARRSPPAGGSAQGREHKARTKGLNLVPGRTSHGNGCPIPHSPVSHPGSGSDTLFSGHLKQLKLNEPVNSRVLENAWRLEQLLNLYQ